MWCESRPLRRDDRVGQRPRSRLTCLASPPVTSAPRPRRRLRAGDFFSVQRECPACHGEGTEVTDPCPTCRGAGRVQVERTVEVNIPPGEGEPVIVEHQPLMGIDYDPKGSEAPAIEITVGATSGAAPRNLTHVINDPTRIWIEEDPDGLGMAVEIESREEGVTKVLFERALPLPP